MEKTYRFLPYFFTAFATLVVYCFYQSYFGAFPNFQNVISPISNVPITITKLTHFHALMVVLWLLMLLVFYGLAIYHRQNSAYHSRFMIMSILPFINPALARIHVEGVPVQFAFWVLFFVIEAFNRKIFKPYLIGLGYYVLNLGLVAYLLMANQALLDRIWHIFFG